MFTARDAAAITLPDGMPLEEMDLFSFSQKDSITSFFQD
jgi:hypothetical protein